MTDEDITAWREVRAALIVESALRLQLLRHDGQVAATINGQRYLYRLAEDGGASNATREMRTRCRWRRYTWKVQKRHR